MGKSLCQRTVNIPNRNPQTAIWVPVLSIHSFRATGLRSYAFTVASETEPSTSVGDLAASSGRHPLMLAGYPPSNWLSCGFKWGNLAMYACLTCSNCSAPRSATCIGGKTVPGQIKIKRFGDQPLNQVDVTTVRGRVVSVIPERVLLVVRWQVLAGNDSDPNNPVVSFVGDYNLRRLDLRDELPDHLGCAAPSPLAPLP